MNWPQPIVTVYLCVSHNSSSAGPADTARVSVTDWRDDRRDVATTIATSPVVWRRFYKYFYLLTYMVVCYIWYMVKMALTLNRVYDVTLSRGLVCRSG